MEKEEQDLDEDSLVAMALRRASSRQLLAELTRRVEKEEQDQDEDSLVAITLRRASSLHLLAELTRRHGQ